jgi:hypothetical protein
MATFDDIARRVLVEAGLSEYGINPEFVLEEWLIGRYLEIINTLLQSLIQEKPTTVITTTPAVNSIGTITLTAGSSSVIGIGTAFNASHVGLVLRPGLVRGWYEITAVADPTHLTLDAPFADATRSDSNYYIAQRYYTLPSSIRWLLDAKNVSRTFNLNIVSREKLDQLYPDRVSNPAVPQWIAPVGIDQTTGHRIFEIYPYADQRYRIEITGYANVDQPTLVTSPLADIDPGLLVTGTVADGLRYRATRDPDRSLENVRGLQDLARSWEGRFYKKLEDLVRRDNIDVKRPRVTLMIQRRDNYGVIDPLITAEDAVWARSPQIG